MFLNTFLRSQKVNNLETQNKVIARRLNDTEYATNFFISYILNICKIHWVKFIKKVNNILAANSTFAATKRFKFESQNFLDPGLS